MLASPLSLGLLLALCSFLVLQGYVPRELPVQEDTVRDLLLARVCQDDVCPAIGAPGSMPGTFQTGFWTLHLAFWEMLGVTPAVMYWVLVAVLAASIGYLAWGVGRRFGAAGGLAAGLAFLALHLDNDAYWRALWNPSLLPLASVGFALAVLNMCRFRSFGSAVASAVFASLAIHGHPAAVLLFLPWGVILLLGYPRKAMWLGLGVGIAVSVASLFLFGRDAVWAMAGEPLRQAGGWGLLAGGAAGVVVAGFALRMVRWLLLRGGVGVGDNGLLYVASALSAAVVGLLWLLRLHSQFEGRYFISFAPLVLSAVVAAGGTWLEACRIRQSAGLGRLRKLRPAIPPVLALSPLLLFLHGAGGRPDSTRWTFADCQAIASTLSQLGVNTFQAAREAIRAPEASSLVAGLTLDLPAAADISADAGQSPSPTSLAFNIVKTPSALPQLPHGWLAATSGNASIVLVPFQPSLRWNEMELRIPGSGGADWTHYSFWPPGWLHRISMALTPQFETLPSQSPGILGRVPFHVPSSGAVRFRSFDNCAHHALVTILDVQGADYHRVSDREVLVSEGQPGRTGFLLLAWTPKPGLSLDSLAVQPNVFELAQEAPLFLEMAACSLCDATQEQTAAATASAWGDGAEFRSQGVTPIARSATGLREGNAGHRVSPSCLASFGVVCEASGYYFPMSAPFTVAVFFYLCALAALGWALWSTSRGSFGSEPPERR